MALAFADIYERHVWQVYAFHAYRVRSRETAEDLTQLTFERALRAWERYDPKRASPLTWLLVIARNLLIDHARADRSTGQVPLDAERHGEPTPPPGLPGLAPALASALAHLGDREREILALRFGADLKGPEIATVTGLSLANVQQILSRSLRQLRTQLADTPAEDLPTRRASQT
jgi:RNA polymerase sigma-70 factor (ECF subfamily)